MFYTWKLTYKPRTGLSFSVVAVAPFPIYRRSFGLQHLAIEVSGLNDVKLFAACRNNMVVWKLPFQHFTTFSFFRIIGCFAIPLVLHL